MPPKEYGNLEDMLEVASRENPKINAYLAQVRTMRANHELTKAAYQPSLDLETGPAYSDREGPGSQWVSSFDIMGVMRWNVFSSGADVAADNAAAARSGRPRDRDSNYSGRAFASDERYLDAVSRSERAAEILRRSDGLQPADPGCLSGAVQSWGTQSAGCS